jgi:hypothetical protein
MIVAILVVYAAAIASIGLGWLYFSRYTIPRPPLGVFNRTDVVVMVGGIVALPYLYLALPLVVVALIFALAMLNVLALAAEPVVRIPRATWLIVLGIGAADVGALIVAGPLSGPFLVVNDLVIALAVVGVTNLWTQCGMRARDLATLGGILAIYDFVATARLPLTTDLIARLAAIPFAPVVAWPVGVNGEWVGLGLGDLLFATAFPLVLRKAYGQKAGGLALVVSLATLAGLLALSALGTLPGAFPVMAILGPLMAVQERFWHRRIGEERTMRGYREASGGHGVPTADHLYDHTFAYPDLVIESQTMRIGRQ